jgi:hypothetical protein
MEVFMFHLMPRGALVSAQATLELDGAPILVGAPALLGRQGEAAGLLVVPV